MKKTTEKIRVGVLGATGIVGQRFIQLLQNHPWFELVMLGASDRNVGKPYGEACKWTLESDMPESVRKIQLVACKPGVDCKLVFSALPADVARETEQAFAESGYAVCSNASAHRYDPDIPLLIPEVNPEHLGLIEIQQKKRGWSGFIVTNPNCTTTHLVCALHPLHQRFKLRKLFVATLQALSGAGVPGVSGVEIVDNVIPFIKGEETKVEEREPQKLLGKFNGDEIEPADFVISAHCNRVPVKDGHLEVVSVEFEQKPSLEEMVTTWKNYQSLPQKLHLPSAPQPAIIYHQASDRPQPRRDRWAGSVPGMATSVGRLRPDPLFHYKFVILGHNTVRGAAGGSLLNAELLLVQNLL